MTSLSCVIIGEGNVAQNCLRHCLSVGLHVQAVFTSTEHLTKFCEKHSIRVFARGATIEKCVKAKSFDYLFSINNPRILNAPVLSLPKRLSVNYHDSPLPAYAGVNATSWAIIHGESDHGISWHVVEPGIDTGDILQYQNVEISKDDSALSLNLKCFDACIEAFKRLVDDILRDNLRPQSQNLSKRSYFGLHDVPPNLGVLSFGEHVEKIYNLARALEFGNHDNPLGSPKVVTHTGHFLLVTNVERSSNNAHRPQIDKITAGDEAEPCTIVAVVDDTIVVTTSSDHLVLSVAELDGHHLTAGQQASYGLTPGAGLSSIGGLDYASAKQIRMKEAFWRRKMKVYEPTTFFIQKLNVLYNILDQCNSYPVRTADIQLPELDIPESTCSYRNWMAASFIAFLGRACCTSEVHVGLLASKDNISPAFKPLYSDVCPGVFCVDFSSSATDAISSIVLALSRHREGKTFLLDMFYRYPELRGIKRVPHHNMVIGLDPMNDAKADPEDYSKYLSDSNVLILLQGRKLVVVYRETPGNSYKHLVDVIRHFPTFLKSLVTLDDSSALLDVDVISEEEASRLYKKPPQNSKDTEDGLLDSFYTHSDVLSDHLAVTSTDIKLTYQQLRSHVTRLCSLMTHVMPYEDQKGSKCVGLHLPNSVAYVVSVVTAVTMECPFLPLPVDLPPHRLVFMLRDVGVTQMITSKEVLTSEKFQQLPISSVILFEDSSPCGDLVMLQIEIKDESEAQGHKQMGLPEVYSFTSLTELDTSDQEEDNTLDSDTCYVIYTSGSTGKPKGVQVRRSGVLNLAKAQIRSWELGPADVIAQFASIGFDAAISEIFTALLSGACLAVLHDSERLGQELVHTVGDLGISTITLPPSVLNMYGPRDFPTLTKIVSAGEACTKNIASKWTSQPGRRFFNAYGPSEATVCATIHEYLAGDGHDTSSQDIPIGQAIDGVQVYLYDDFLKPVPPGVIGEMYICGKGVAAGYIGHATDKNKERFVTSPLDGVSVMYRTGDHAIQERDGTLTYVGRLDDQVKVRGQRVDLSEIEQIILQHTKVEMAVVVKHATKTSADTCIAAFVAPTFVYTSELREYLSKVLPKYMIPTYIKKMNVEDFPTTTNGKVDRRKLEHDKSIFENNSSAGNSHLNETQLQMAKLWCDVLQLDQTYVYNMHRLSTFSEHGGNSLHMVLLQRAIEDKFNLLLSFTDIGAASTIEDFSDIIKRKKDMLRASDDSHTNNNVLDLKELILQDSVLETKYTIESTNILNKEGPAYTSSPTNILLSGVTGFLGAFLLQEILEQSNAHVCCMVRETSEVRGFGRIVSNMRKYNLWKSDYGSRIAVVLSDLSRPEMGIAPDIYKSLCEAVDVVFMNAAQMNFNTDYRDHRQANVIGTKEFIKFACTGKKKYLFTTSSLAVFLFSPPRESQSIISDISVTDKSSDQDKVGKPNTTETTSVQKKKLGERLSLNDQNLIEEENSKNSAMDLIDITLNGTDLKENAQNMGKNGGDSNNQTNVMISQNNNPVKHKPLQEQLSGPEQFDSDHKETNIHNEKLALRKTRSVDMMKEIFAKVSPKGKKQVQISPDAIKEPQSPVRKTINYRETDIIKDPTILVGGYGQSKWASEQLVLQALEHLPGGAVFRPARISGHSGTGVGPVNDLFASMLIGMEKMGFIPDIKFPFDLTPVDFCAKGMIEIMLQICKDLTKEMPNIYHFFNKSTVPFTELFEGVSVDKLPLDQWRQELRKVERDNPLLPLTPFMNSDFWDRSCDWPTFSTTNTDKYVSAQCQENMPHTRELLKVYRKFFQHNCQYKE